MTALPSPGSVSLRSVLAGRSVGIRCSIGAEDSAVVRESTSGRGRLSTTGVTTGGCRTIAGAGSGLTTAGTRSEEHTSELQSHSELVCRLLLEKKKRVMNDEQAVRIISGGP